MKIDRNFLDKDLSDEEFTAVIAVTATIIMIAILRNIDLPKNLEGTLELDITLSYIVAVLLGKKRKIGFGTTYIVSLLFTPIVGCIAAFASQRRK